MAGRDTRSRFESDLFGVTDTAVVGQAAVFPVNPVCRAPSQIVLPTAERLIAQHISQNSHFSAQFFRGTERAVSWVDPRFLRRLAQPIHRVADFLMARVIPAVPWSRWAGLPINGGLQTVIP